MRLPESVLRKREESGLLSGGLFFCMLFTDFSDVFVFKRDCVCMPLRRLLMLLKKEMCLENSTIIDKKN